MRPVLLFLIALGVFGGVSQVRSATFAQESTGGSESSRAPAARTGILQAIAHHRSILLKLPGVVAVKRGTGVNANEIVVVVEEVTPKLERRIPKQLDGWPVELEVADGHPAYNLTRGAVDRDGRPNVSFDDR